MLIVSPSTASALAPHASERSWVMFVQVTPPGLVHGPILIEGIKGTQIGARLRALARDNAYDAMLIGLIESATPDDDAELIKAHAGTRVHDDWFAPAAELLAYVQQHGQAAITELLAQTQPGALPDVPVAIEEMAALLGVSVSTIRRMVDKKEIPVMRMGKILRFVPADVFASIHRHGR